MAFYTPKAVEKSAIMLDIEISMVSNIREISASEIGIDSEKLPTAFRKCWKAEIFENGFLTELSSIRAGAEMCLSKAGAKTPMGFFHTRRKAAEALAQLNKKKAEWEALLLTKEMQYDDMIKRQLKLVRSGLDESGLDAETVDKMVAALAERQSSWEELKSKFTWAQFTTPITLDQKEFDSEYFQDQMDGVTQIYDSVMGSMIKEVSTKAAKSLKSLFKQEENGDPATLRINNRTTTALSELADKLYELSFVHKNLKALYEQFVVFLEQFEGKTGKALRGADYTAMRTALICLSDQIELVAKLEAGEPFLAEIRVEDFRSSIEMEIEKEVTAEAHSGIFADADWTPCIIDEEVSVDDAVDQFYSDEAAIPEMGAQTDMLSWL